MSEKSGMENWQSFQNRMFELIGEQYTSRGQMVLDLGDLLKIERSVIYDRISGTKMMPLEECFILMQHYNITAKLISSLWANKFLVNFGALEHAPTSLKEYLQPLHASLRAMSLTEGVHLYYAAGDLPFYHYYRSPKLALVKYYVWHLLSWQQGDGPECTFDREYISSQQADLLPMFEDMVTFYENFTSTEVWHTHILHNTLHQIEYLFQIGQLPDNTLAMELCDDLIAILNDLERMASHGHKDGHPENGFQLYHNELSHTNNMALMKTANISQVFFAYDSPNVMNANDDRLGRYTYNFFERLISHADGLSTSSHKSRTIFFKRLRDQILGHKKRYEKSAY